MQDLVTKNKLKNFCILNIIVAFGFIILIAVFERFDFLSCFALSVVAKQLPKAIKNLHERNEHESLGRIQSCLHQRTYHT